MIILQDESLLHLGEINIFCFLQHLFIIPSLDFLSKYRPDFLSNTSVGLRAGSKITMVCSKHTVKKGFCQRLYE